MDALVVAKFFLGFGVSTAIFSWFPFKAAFWLSVAAALVLLGAYLFLGASPTPELKHSLHSGAAFATDFLGKSLFGTLASVSGAIVGVFVGLNYRMKRK